MITSLPKVNKDGVLAIHSTAQNRLGEYFCNNLTNRLWVYLRANVAIPEGAGIASVAPTAFTTGLLAAAAGTKELKFSATVNLDTAFPRVPNQPRFYEYMHLTQTGGSQLGVVHEHRDRECSVQWYSEDDLKLTTALAANADVSFAVPWLVRIATTGGDVIGFAQRAIKIGEYFWALVEGVGWGIAGAAVAAGAALRIDGTDGRLDDLSTGAAVVRSAPCAYSIDAQTVAAALVPIVAAAPVRIGILPFQGGRSQTSHEYPSAN